MNVTSRKSFQQRSPCCKVQFPLNQDKIMNQRFGIGAGLLIALVGLVIRIPYVVVILVSWAILPLLLPVVGELVGYYVTRKITQTWRWPDEPDAVAFAGKWIAILIYLLSAIAIILFCLGLYFTLFPLLLIPPILIGAILTTRLLLRSLRQPRNSWKDP
jgi:hypothetical protein